MRKELGLMVLHVVLLRKLFRLLMESFTIPSDIMVGKLEKGRLCMGRLHLSFTVRVDLSNGCT